MYKTSIKASQDYPRKKPALQLSPAKTGLFVKIVSPLSP